MATSTLAVNMAVRKMEFLRFTEEFCWEEVGVGEHGINQHFILDFF
jgi:hypothetical protein